MSAAGIAAAPSIKISPTFNKENADVILISNDKVRFHVHKRDLSYHSQFFNDLFELGAKTGNGRPEIKLNEVAANLEIALTYCYPGSKPQLKIENSTLSLIPVLDKYQISEGLDAIRDAFFAELGKFGGGSDYKVFASLFAKKYGYDSLFKRAMQDLYYNTKPSELTHLKKAIWNSYRDEANLVGFLLLSRLVEFNILKSKKLQEICKQTPAVSAVEMAQMVLNFDFYAQYINLQREDPRGLLGTTSSVELNNRYKIAISELQVELKALEMKF